VSRWTGALAGAALAGAGVLRVQRARRVGRARTAAPPTVTVDGGARLHVDVDGPADAPATVVLVHGFAARSSMYDPQWAALAESARVVRYDQRGHGRSGWAGSLRATPRRLGRDLGRVVDTVAGAGPVVLVGHSMGGMAVLALAHQRPELFGSRVAGVALLSTVAAPLAAAGRDPGSRTRPRTALGVGTAWLLWLAAPLLQALHPFRTAPVQRVLRRRLFGGEPPADAVREMTDAWTATPTAVMAAHLLGLARYDQCAAVEALRGVPVLVLAGTEDATIPPDAARRLAERIGPNARLVLVPGAGHMVTLTHAAAVTAALQDLLTQIRAATDARRAS
jgi:pimeloyl-ACP methyl ester carboxylesterase